MTDSKEGSKPSLGSSKAIEKPPKKPKEEVKAKTKPKLSPVTRPKINDILKAKNISNKVINTSKCSIAPGESGTCTVAESKTLGKFLKVE